MAKSLDEIIGGLIDQEQKAYDDIDAQMSALPQEDQQNRERLNNAKQLVRRDFSEKRRQASVGLYTGEEEQEKTRSGFQWVMDQLNRLNNTKNALLVAGTTSDPNLRNQYTDLAGKAFTDSTTRPITGSEVLEKGLGMGEGGKLSDVAPFLFSKTGEGLPLKEGGALDVTTRGAAGFAGDVLTDPLNFLPIGKIAKGAAALAGEGVEKLAGRPVREIIYDSMAPIKDLARKFNKYAFLGRPAKEAAETETALKSTEDVLGSAGSLIENQLGKSPAFNQFIQSAEKEQLWKHAATLDDAATAIKSEDFKTLDKVLPDWKDYMSQIKSAKGYDWDKLTTIYLKNQGVDLKGQSIIKFFQNKFADLGTEKVKNGLLTLDEMAKRPLYIPRKWVDLDFPQGKAEIDQIMAANPQYKDIIENMILKPADPVAQQLDLSSINSILRDRIRPGIADKDRVFKSYLESSNFAKIFGGDMEKNLATLLFDKLNKFEKDKAFSALSKQLDTIWGKNKPKEVIDTIKQIAIKETPEAWNPMVKAWNKWFLNPLKKSLTVAFPGFLIRNAVDNVIRGYEGLGIKYFNPQKTADAFHILFDADQTIKFANGLERNAQEILPQAMRMGVWRKYMSATQYEKVLDDVTRQFRIADPAHRSILRTAQKALDYGQTLGSWSDNHARIKSFLVGVDDYIEKHGIKAGDMKGMQEAYLYGAKMSKKTYFSYQDLGPMDDMLAQFLPFYRFARQNIPFQIDTLINNPQRLGVIAKAQNQFNQNPLSPEEESFLAPYIREGINLSLGDSDTGEHLTLNSLGLSMEDFNKLWSSEGLARTLEKISVGQAASPIQFLYSYMTNRNPYFGLDLNDHRMISTNKIFHDNSLLNKLVGGVNKVITKKTDENGNPVFNYELDNPKQYALVMTVLSPAISAAVQRIPIVGSLAGAAASPRALSLGQAALKDDITKRLSTLQAITGVRVTKTDIKSAKITKLVDDLYRSYDDLKQHMAERRIYEKLGRRASDPDSEMDEDMYPGLNTD